MEVFRRFVRTVQARVKAITNSSLNFALEFKIIEFLFHITGINPFVDRQSKMRTCWFYILFLFFFTNGLHNTLVDFAGDKSKQFSAFVIACATMQMIFKQTSLKINKTKLIALKQELLADAANLTEQETKDRKIIRFIILSFVAYYTVFAFLLMISPIFSSKEFMMPAYLQLPWTNLHSHPSYEVNYVAFSCIMSIGVFFTCPFDGFYIMITLHCVSQLKVCCHRASILADSEPEESCEAAINDFVKMHLKVQKLIKTIDSIFDLSNFGQLATFYGLFVTVISQFRFEIDYTVLVISLAVMVQLFIYCLLSEYVSIVRERLQFALYSSKWYNIKSIALRKRILFILLNMQDTKSFSTAGLIDINLATYKDIVKSGYSFITFLKEVF